MRQVLLSSYRVLSQGVNLHHCCNAMVLLEAPQSASSGIQAMSRVHRLGQTRPQVIYNVTVDHTYDMVRSYQNARKYFPTLGGDISELLNRVATTIHEQYRAQHGLEEPVDISKFLETAKIRCTDEIYKFTFGLIESPFYTVYKNANVLLRTVDELREQARLGREQDPYASIKQNSKASLSRKSKNRTGMDEIRPAQRCVLCTFRGCDPADCGSVQPTCRSCFLGVIGEGILGKADVRHCIHLCGRDCKTRFNKLLKRSAKQALLTQDSDDSSVDDPSNQKPDDLFLIGQAMKKADHSEIDSKLYRLLVSLNVDSGNNSDKDANSDAGSDAGSDSSENVENANTNEQRHIQLMALLRVVSGAALRAANRCEGRANKGRRTRQCLIRSIGDPTAIPCHAGFDGAATYRHQFNKDGTTLNGCLDCQKNGDPELCHVTADSRACCEGDLTVLTCTFHQEAMRSALSAFEVTDGCDLTHMKTQRGLIYASLFRAARLCGACELVFPPDPDAAILSAKKSKSIPSGTPASADKTQTQLSNIWAGFGEVNAGGDPDMSLSGALESKAPAPVENPAAAGADLGKLDADGDTDMKSPDARPSTSPTAVETSPAAGAGAGDMSRTPDPIPKSDTLDIDADTQEAADTEKNVDNQETVDTKKTAGTDAGDTSIASSSSDVAIPKSLTITLPLGKDKLRNIENSSAASSADPGSAPDTSKTTGKRKRKAAGSNARVVDGTSRKRKKAVASPSGNSTRSTGRGRVGGGGGRGKGKKAKADDDYAPEEDEDEED